MSEDPLVKELHDVELPLASGMGTHVQQEWTLRLVAFGSIAGLTVLGVFLLVGNVPADGGVIALLSAIITCMCGAVTSVVGAKAALQTPGAPKNQ